MLQKLLILLLMVLAIHGVDYACGEGFMCIPLSECKELRHSVENGFHLMYARDSLCGYFHEPYVCCDRTCTTPNGNYGRITFLDYCLDLKANEGATDRRSRKFLSESHVNETHVCCNEGENMYNSVPVAPAVMSTTPKPSGSICVTPNGEIARCRHINECEVYKQVAFETDENFHFINDSFCGFWKEPMVCCGDMTQYTENYKDNLPSFEICGKWDTTLNSNVPPWLALIKQRHSSKVCVGALINDQYVLTTVECVEQDQRSVTVKVGNCINNENRQDCSFEVSEFKQFPLYAYVRSEDVGIVLLKLDRAVEVESGLIPVCLPTSELAISEAIAVVGLQGSSSRWTGGTTSTTTIHNDYCHNSMKEFIARIVCMTDKNLCRNINRPLLQNVVLRNGNNQWYLEGLFNKENCYGDNEDFLNAIYVYKFVPWIKTNLN